MQDGKRRHLGTIGVLAGMGPRSTAPFIDVLACQQHFGCQFDDDFPAIHVLSWPTPFRLDGKGMEYEQSMKEAVAAGFEKLLACGVDVLCLPCHSAHAYVAADGPDRPENVRWVSLIDAALALLPQEAARVVLWATPSTVDSGIYQASLRGRFDSGLTSEQQPEVTSIITLVKQGSLVPASVAVRSLITALSQRQRPAPVVLVACTEINAALIAAGVTRGQSGLIEADGILLLDSSFALAEAVTLNLPTYSA